MDGWKLPADTYNAALDQVESEYGVDPERDPTGTGRGNSTTAIPFGRLETMDPDDTRRHAKRRGIEWPNTDEGRERLQNRIYQAFRAGETIVIDAPTALGKSQTVATEPWLRRTTLTGDVPVI